jgi:hypothetical protein
LFACCVFSVHVWTTFFTRLNMPPVATSVSTDVSGTSSRAVVISASLVNTKGTKNCRGWCTQFKH